MDGKKDKKDLTLVGDLIRQDPRLKPPTAVQMRLIEAAADIRQNSPEDISYQHTVLCQTGLPYRDTDTRVWKRRNGRVERYRKANGCKKIQLAA